MAKFHCPACRVPLVRAEYLSGVCPVCEELTGARRSQLFSRAGELRPATDPRRPSIQKPLIHDEPLAPGWRTVQKGLNMMLIAIMLMLICTVLLLLVSVAANATQAGFRRGGPGLQSMLAPMCLLVVPVLIAGLLDVLGRLLCCSVPSESGARPLAVGMVFCLVGVVLVLALAFLPAILRVRPPRRGAADLMILLSFASAVLGMLSVLFFVLFLRAVAVFFGNHTLAKSCVSFLVFCVIFGGLSVLGILFLFLSRFGSLFRYLEVVILFVAIAAGMIFVAVLIFVWYVRLIMRTRDTIRRTVSVSMPMFREEY